MKHACLSSLINFLSNREVHKDVSTITSDSFILNAVSNCHIEFDHEPDQQICTTRPSSSFSLAEQQIIDNEVAKFIAKGIIRPTVLSLETLCLQFLLLLKRMGHIG